MSTRFLQLHTLTSYPASLLNRDDAGMAKQIPFGGAVRTRISSQCLKRHWRRFKGDHSLHALEHKLLSDPDQRLAVRSRVILERLVMPELLKDFPQDMVDQALAFIEKLFLKAKEKKESEDDEEESQSASNPETEGDAGESRTAVTQKQVIVLGHREIAFIAAEARAVLAEFANAAEIKSVAGDKKKLKARTKAVKVKWDSERKKNMISLAQSAGLDAAVFGRMVTSDVLARCDAAIHVAHAFTVHAAQSEADYFSAVDELTSDAGETGAGHINSTDLTSGLFYGYVAVDVGLIKKNLGDDLDLAGKTVEAVVHLIATVSPGAKLGSTAPHSFAHLMLAEAGSRQPCTLANAFLKPVELRGDLLAATYNALAQEVGDLDANFGSAPARRYMARGPNVAIKGAEAKTMPELAAWCREQVL